ncbi:hypothetical protein [Nocardia sp. NPDC050406]|uniref:hypothetical protein n=1 Tax=Nocardia sp. NPDC050406 TaxID=3364318 RepID=UPI003790E9EE
MNYPPQQPPGQGWPQQPPPGWQQQGGPRQGYPQQPQQHSPQGQPQWGQQPQWAPPPPGGPTPPVWKSPIVLGLGAIAVVGVIVVGLVAVTSGDDSEATAAKVTTTTTQSAPSTSSATKSTTTTTKATTTAKAAALSPEGTTIVQAFPEALRQSVLKNEVKEKDPTGTMDTFTKKVVGTIAAGDALTVGLMHHQNNDHYPIAWIDTDPSKLRRIWSSQHPERTTDEGSKLVRIDPSYPNGSAALEVFIPSSNLYFSMSGFSNADAAKQFVQRAGF